MVMWKSKRGSCATSGRARVLVAVAGAVVLGCCLCVSQGVQGQRATAFMYDDEDFTGTVTFHEQADLVVHVQANFQRDNLDKGEHGFHVHQYGEISTPLSLDSVGSHFVPNCLPEQNCSDDQTHGLPPSQIRQLGDMGNCTVSGSGQASYNLTLRQDKMGLNHDIKSVLGRSVAVHETRDDGSQPTGDAGNVALAGIIVAMSSGTMAARNDSGTRVVTCYLGQESNWWHPHRGTTKSGAIQMERGVGGTVSITGLFTNDIDGNYKLGFREYVTDKNDPATGPELRPNAANDIGENGTLQITVVNGEYDNAGSEPTVNGLWEYVGRLCTLSQGSNIRLVGAVGIANPDTTLEDLVFPSDDDDDDDDAASGPSMADAYWTGSLALALFTTLATLAYPATL